MNLDEAQRKKVAGWVQEGLKLSDVQNRIAAEFGVRMTYMEVRFLVDDLKVVPKDAAPRTPVPALTGGKPEPGPATPAMAAPASEPTAAPPGGVSLSVDQLTRPGAMVSGKVTFSDGQKADWYFDQSGRLALLAEEPGYRPPAADLQQFQAALESELSKLGF